MATFIKPELSKKNNYWIGKHRYYELKHFCMQYPEWKAARLHLESLKTNRFHDIFVKSDLPQAPTESLALRRAYYDERIEIVDKAAAMTDPIIGPYILSGAIRDRSYDVMRASIDIPCGREMYYELYRKFFWILSELRQ